MSQWQEGEPEPWDWDDLKKKALIGAGCAVVVLAWLVFSRPSEEAASSRGFNLGSAGGPPVSARGRPFAERAPQTGLDMVTSDTDDGPAGVIPGLLPGPPVLPAPISAAANPAAAAGPPPSGAPAPAEDSAAMASAGIPADAGGLNRLGAQKGLLSSLALKMLDHPNVLKAIFNNKMVVDAFMSRDTSDALSKDPTAVMSIALSNSKALGVLSDPRMAAALASNPQASGLLAGVQSKMGGGQ